MRIAIVDDDIQMYERLKTYFNELLGSAAELTYFPSGEEFLKVQQPGAFDLILLDIFMGKLTGMDVARELRRTDKEVRIVFATTSNEFACESYEVNACYYLHKPFEQARSRQLLDDLLRILQHPEPEIEVRFARKLMRLPYSKVYYALAQNHFVRIMSDEGECRATGIFAQVEKELCADPRFLVCNRGIIINMSAVLRFENDCIQMLDGTQFPVRQKDKGRLFATFTQYQFRHMRREI